MNLQEIYNDLKQVKSTPAVSLFIPTHRTFPDNEQDSIALKNAISDLEKRLLDNFTKREIEPLLSSINQELTNHDHNYNLDTLAIFATNDGTKVFKFPFKTPTRTTIDESFALRDLVREMNSSVQYYILVASRTNARLFEIFNDQLVYEFDHKESLQNSNFPLENTTLYTTNSADRANSITEENYLKEFLNRVDKSVQEVYKKNPLPLFVVGNTQTISSYQQICDNPSIIVGTVTNSANLDAEARFIIEETQSAVNVYKDSLGQEALNEISKTKNDNLLMEDLSDIYRASTEGRIDTLFIRKGYVQAAHVDKDLHVTLESDGFANSTTDDIVNDILEVVLQNRGLVKFIESDYFPERSNLLAKLRY